jgi:hypothetical protein
MPESTKKDNEIDYRKKVKGTINKAVTIFSAGAVISPRRTGQLSPRALSQGLLSPFVAAYVKVHIYYCKTF